MTDNLAQLLVQVHRVQVAWDRYNIQRRLPDDQNRLVQGHPWDAYNSERGVPQARRNAQAMSAAWNDLEAALLELSYASDRVRSELPATGAAPAARTAGDRRVGPYSAASDLSVDVAPGRTLAA